MLAEFQLFLGISVQRAWSILSLVTQKKLEKDATLCEPGFSPAISRFLAMTTTSRPWFQASQFMYLSISPAANGVAAFLVAAAIAVDDDLAGEPGLLHRLRTTDGHDVIGTEDGADVRMLLQHGGGNVIGLGGIPVGGLARHDFDCRVLGELGHQAIGHVDVLRRGQLPLQDHDLAGLAAAGAAVLNDLLAGRFGLADPVAADVAVA